MPLSKNYYTMVIKVTYATDYQRDLHWKWLYTLVMVFQSIVQGSNKANKVTFTESKDK